MRLSSIMFFLTTLVIHFYAQAKPVIIDGFIISKSNKTALPNVQILNLKTKQSTKSGSTGYFSISAEMGSKLTFSLEGYKIDTVSVNKTTHLKIELLSEAAPIPEEPSEPPFPEVSDEISSSKLFSLKSVFFDSAKWDLRPESTEELTRLYEYLEENPDLSIQINAHTDNVGSNKANQKLSQQRSQSVVEFLIEMGIDSSRLEAKGFGEEYPIAPNDSDEGRQENRRVEFMTKNI